MSKTLPSWIEWGAFLLVYIAGIINTIGLLGFQHQAVAHVTGTLTLLGSALAGHEWSSGWHLSWIVFAFCFGALLSGLIIQNATLKLGRRYGVALLIEAGLLFVAMHTLVAGSGWGHLFASAACGLQNAMITTYSGAVIRTTHMTGILTDIGLMLGHWLRGHRIDLRKIQLFVILITGFTCGSVSGNLLFTAFHFYALVVPILLAVLLAFVYWLYWFLKSE